MDLSILIPARCERFLKETVEDALKNIEADTEIIVTLDGQWADPVLVQHERVNIIYVPEAIGQRAATNVACKLSRAKYVMKLDAHCSFDKGFDRKMIELFKSFEGWVCREGHLNKEKGPCKEEVVDMESDYADYNKECGEDTSWQNSDNITAVPIMRNLWAYDWKCYKCGLRIYQDKKAYCDVCKTGDHMKRKMLWIGKHNPQSTSFCFDSEPHFQYFEEWKHREPYTTDKKTKGYTETMSLQGSCFMLTRENYWKWGVCDEKAGSWGNQGLEVACATWLSGGRVLVNHKTWYAHMFRTKGDVFGFPYPQSGRGVDKTKKYIKDKFWSKKHPGQIHPVSWLVKKFWPVKGWTQEDLNRLD